MRTYGRINGVWTEVLTDSNGFNDQCYLTTLVQVLKLNLGESPFWANMGIPALNSAQMNLPPDAYVAIVQQYFAQYFANLSVARVPGQANPTYNIFALTNYGAQFFLTVAT
jgi:hypothetical protein